MVRMYHPWGAGLGAVGVVLRCSWGVGNFTKWGETDTSQDLEKHVQLDERNKPVIQIPVSE
jgi:hypothetical protein